MTLASPRSVRWPLLLLPLLLAGLSGCGVSTGSTAVPDLAEPAQQPPRPGAPARDGGIAWLNTSRPISMKHLRRKVLILDFWTYCCINCIHTLPDLAKLEKKYANQLVVIGVHSAKFENEKDAEHIRKAILRYEISHPVVNDSEMKIWRAFKVNYCLTVGVMDAECNYRRD